MGSTIDLYSILAINKLQWLTK